MKITSWNVNGIRAVAKKGFLDWFSKNDADVICIQETKAFQEQIPKEILHPFEYNVIWHAGTRAGYAGTAIYTRLPIISSKNTFEGFPTFSDDGRLTEVELENNLVILNVYFPNGGTRADGTEMLSYKLQFYVDLITYIKQLQSAGKEVICCGDYNICHTEIDIARPKANQNSIGFLPIEREMISTFLQSAKMTDIFRHLYPEQIDTYSWWSYRGGARTNNVGWRLDYFTTTKKLLNDIQDISYDTEVLGSDHCPVSLYL
ncbi:exodeoxyribonuclease III [Candidatus Peregrinibacteria bacterium]|nr:MAG: exodeoxyribonuclease III [Candidatus Peregrinibacteria bacterium]